MIDETVFNQVIGDLFYDKRQEALARTALVRYLGALDHAQRQERVIRLAVPYISQWLIRRTRMTIIRPLRLRVTVGLRVRRC